MATIDQLVIEIDVKTAELRRQLRGANQAVEKSSKGMRRSLDRVNASGAKLTRGLGKLKGGIAAAGLGLAARAFSGVNRSAIQAADTIVKTADAIGLSTDALQEMRFAGERSGIAIGNMDNALKGFGQRLGQARADTGSLAELLKKTDKELLANVTAAGSLDDALDLVFVAMAEAGDASERLALGQAAFGRAGKDLVNVVADGVKGYRDMRRAANELDTVIGEHLLRSAVRTNDAFTDLDFRMAKLRTENMVKMAPVVLTLTEAFNKLKLAAAGGVEFLIKPFIPPEFLSDEDLKARIKEARRAVDTADLGSLFFEDVQQERLAEALAEAKRRRLRREARAAALAGTGDPTAGTGDAGIDPDPFGDLTASLNRHILAINNEAAALGKGAGARAAMNAQLELSNLLADEGITLDAPRRKVFGFLLDDLGEATDRLAALSGAQQQFNDLMAEARGPAGDYADAIRDLTILVDANRITQEQANRAGSLAMARFEAAATATRQATDATDGYRLAIDNVATAIGTSLEDALVDAREGFGGLRDVLRAVEKDIIRIVARISITKPLEAAIGGFDFGGLFGGGGSIDLPAELGAGTIVAGFGHRGGVVGGLPSRAVSPLAFLAAPRLHGGGIVGMQPSLRALGLGPRERPVIAEVGERIVPRGGGNTFNINIVAPAGESRPGFRESAAYVARRAADEIDRRQKFR